MGFIDVAREVTCVFTRAKRFFDSKNSFPASTSTLMFCIKCGSQLPDGSRFCAKCGEQLGGPAGAPPPVPPQGNMGAGTRDAAPAASLIYPKNPPVSPHVAWLAIFLPGLPHMVFGQVAKGLVLTIAFFVSIPTGVGPLIILIAALIDAYFVGNTLKAGRPVGKWQFFPK